MRKGAVVLVAIMAIAIVTSPAIAGVPVQVTVTGEVEFNQISAPPLGNANPGDPATMTFLVDSDIFTDSVNFPTRGYDIDQSSFSFTLGSTVIGLEDPFPAGQTPFFTLRDNDPAVDGFWVSTNVDFPAGVPLSQTGIFGQFLDNFSVTYQGDTLPSLDILDALGTYDFTGLTVFNFTVDDGPFNAMGLVFEQMTIEAVQPETGACCTPFACEDVAQEECVGIFQGEGSTCADEGICEGPLRVTICHIPPGNPNNPRTIMVSIRALGMHLERHGDSLGPCAANNQQEPRRDQTERNSSFSGM